MRGTRKREGKEGRKGRHEVQGSRFKVQGSRFEVPGSRVQGVLFHRNVYKQVDP
jgi:hypothetical protein